MKFKNDIEAEAIIEVQSGLKDKDNLLGSAGQLLSSTGSQVSWVDASGLSAKTAEAVVQPIKANEALSKGDPLYIVGFQAGQNVNIVAKADASNSAKMPVVGLADDDYSNQDFGTMTAFGSFNGAFDTTGGTESWSIGDIIYVKPGGGLTNVKPTGTNLIQNIAIVSRVQQNTGELEVIALGRTNDVPNLPTGRLFVGTATNTSLSSNVVYIDEANDRVGIGTSSPSANLEIESTGTGDAILVTNNDATSTAAPVLTLKRDSASPADGDYLGQIKFKGENDASQEIVYAKITAKTSDVTDTTEDGLIETAVKSGGSNLIVSRQTGTDLKLINGVGIEVDGDATFSSGNITLGGTGRIQGIDTVSATTDAANKAYVDANAGATNLNGLTDCLVDTDSLYVGEVPSGLSGNPQSNTTLGIDVLNSLTSGVRNTCIGNDVATLLTTANENTVVGYQALQNQNTLGNTALGAYSGGNGSGGAYSVYVGYKSGQNNATNGHISIGGEAGYSNTSGAFNTNIGYQAGYSNTTSSYRTCIGYEAGKSSTGQWNTLIGASAGKVTTGAGSVAVGRNALLNNTSGGSNVAIGMESGNQNTTGYSNVFVGRAAGRQNSTGYSNVAVGYEALRANLGSQNTALGYQSGLAVTTGHNNTMIGYDAEASSATVSNEITLGNNNITSFRIPGIQSGASDGDVLTYNASAGKLELQAGGGGGASDLNGLTDCLVDTGSLYVGEVPAGLSGNPQGNTVLGIDAGNSLTTGTNNVAIGFEALSTATATNNKDCVAIGYRALKNQDAGVSARNIAIGFEAGRDLTTVNANVFIGSMVSRVATTGTSESVAIGNFAMNSNTGAAKSVVIGNFAGSSGSGGDGVSIGYKAARSNTNVGHHSIGYQAGYSNTSGGGNTNLGFESGYQNTTGYNNTNLGYGTGKFNSGNNNLNIGHQAGSKSSQAGDYNVYIGSYSGQNNAGSTFYNTVVGGRALRDVTTGSNNTALGYKAGTAMTTGGNNTLMGYQAGDAIVGGGSNTCVGYSSGGSITSGSGNVTLGYLAGQSIGNGTNNVAIGSSTDGTVNGTNTVVIGYQATSSIANASNQVTLGNSSISTLRCAVTSITSLSDERDKTDIKDLGYGLAFIDALQPREFVWDNRPETDKDGEEFYSANKGKKDFGFIAQEVRELDNDTLRLVYSENEEKLEMSYGKLVPVLVQAIKELKAEIELLKS